ncbi:transglutaminase-like domain-containing protein [Methanobacterium alcaliphilum]|uniref:transglutaminase-like domain-containing protein n=1 Tax=Methanobacterium alcaliphilum TaxID=392018 RepID=UPI00200A8B1D|nr:transglutaminase-like domain-containing protein [Methanobacterium alcaliphilum]MCK9150694.1 transglutaminase-like domain-containing protein [Methanobacterium alcaliphilum]
MNYNGSGIVKNSEINQELNSFSKSSTESVQIEAATTKYVKVYKKVWYKQRYKQSYKYWYKSKGKWKYRTKYKWAYKWKYKWVVTYKKVTNDSTTPSIVNNTNATNTTKSNNTIVNNSSNSNISALNSYLKATTNCQVNNSVISSRAVSITSNKNNTYDKAVAIFNWVRDNIGYSFYYNTKYGALGTLNKKTGNCVDTSHILIGLLRTSGIPARYVHGTCKFSSGSTYGHVWAEVYVNGTWYKADASSSRNSFNVIKNWDTSTVIIKNRYASLPF